MKLGYLISQYPAITHTFVLREVRELRRLGFDVCTISVRRPDRPVDAMTAIEAEEARRTPAILALPAVRIAGIHLRTLLRRPGGYFRGLLAALRMSAPSPRGLFLSLAYFAEAVATGYLLCEAGVDHFHVHFSSNVGILIVKVFAIRMSITLHGPAEFFDMRAFHLREKVESSLFVRAISSFGASQIMLATAYNNWARIETVRLGVDGARFQPRLHERTAHSPFELLCVGRLTKVKGQHVLLEAVAGLIATGYRVRLRLVGDGPDRSDLAGHAQQLGIADSVVFEGWADEDRVREFYAYTDIFVLASFAEGIPVVLMEAMAMELPVVATWVNGVPELIDNDRNGLLCAPGNAAAMAAAVAKLIDRADLRARLGAAARQTVLEKYDIARNARLWAGVIERRLSVSSGSILAEAKANTVDAGAS